MIFKKQDCTDIAINKKATQSSISQYSNIDDASRVLRSDLEVDDFAMHTGWEESPWWLLDLEVETPIDCIRVTNRGNKARQESLKNIKIELSLDKRTWTLVDSSCFEWQGGLDVLDVNIYQAMSARYIKISLQGDGCLVLKKVEVFVRKIKGLALACLMGGYGDRLIAFLNAMYIAKYSELKFAFSWKIYDAVYTKPLKDNVHFNPMQSILEIFDESFIKEYSCTNYNKIKNVEFIIKPEHIKNNINDFTIQTSLNPYGYYFTCYPLSLYIQNLPQDFEKEYPRLFKEIKFSPQINEAMSLAKDIFNANFQGKDAIAIHLRSGDIIYSHRRATFSFLFYDNKVMPIEIALELILRNLDKDIILFGENAQLISMLIDFISSKYQKHLYSVKDFIPKNLTPTQIDFFEIKFMSYCKEIFSGSGFARLASLIRNGKESIIWSQIFALQEQFDALEKHINTLKIDDFQSAFSYFAYFMVARKLGKSNEFLYELLKKAESYDDKNYLFKVLIVSNLLDQGKYEQAEKYLKDHLNQEFIGFLQWIVKRDYVHYPDFWTKEEFILINYDEAQASKFPYISYVIAKKSLILSAKARIKDFIAYKFGSAIIKNSKSLIGYLKMPYILISTIKKHKQEQKAYKALIKQNPELTLPELDTYKDYQDALKEKECLTYKLGLAYIKACRTWYKGGFVKFYFEAKRLEKEFKKSKK